MRSSYLAIYSKVVPLEYVVSTNGRPGRADRVMRKITASIRNKTLIFSIWASNTCILWQLNDVGRKSWSEEWL